MTKYELVNYWIQKRDRLEKSILIVRNLLKNNSEIKIIEKQIKLITEFIDMLEELD